MFELEDGRPGLNDPAPVPTTPGTISGYRPVGKARPLDAALFDGFRTLLLDSQTYLYIDLPPNTGVGKLCGPFRPGVAVRFWADGNNGPTYVDALLCFFCSDVALVSGGAKSAPGVHDIHGGELALLRLASAALPGVQFFSERLASKQDERAREVLFLSMFPPGTQVAMHPPQGDLDFSSRPKDHDRFVRDAADRLAKSATGPEVLVTVARAFALRSRSWHETDNMTEIALAATRRLSIDEIAAGLKLAEADQVVLAGIAEVASRGGLQRDLPSDLRGEWAARLAEAALIVSPQADVCPLLDRLAELPGARGRPLLDRVAKGELRQAERRWPGFADRASARGCALLAEVRHDGPRALTDAKAWKPTGSIDQATRSAVVFLSGEESALDGAVLGVESNAVAQRVFDWFRTQPTREHIDLLVRVIVASPTEYGVGRVERLLNELAGAKLDPAWNATLEARVTALRGWWTDHSPGWRVPTGPRGASR